MPTAATAGVRGYTARDHALMERIAGPTWRKNGTIPTAEAEPLWKKYLEQCDYRSATAGAFVQQVRKVMAKTGSRRNSCMGGEQRNSTGEQPKATLHFDIEEPVDPSLLELSESDNSAKQKNTTTFGGQNDEQNDDVEQELDELRKWYEDDGVHEASWQKNVKSPAKVPVETKLQLFAEQMVEMVADEREERRKDVLHLNTRLENCEEMDLFHDRRIENLAEQIHNLDARTDEYVQARENDAKKIAELQTRIDELQAQIAQNDDLHTLALRVQTLEDRNIAQEQAGKRENDVHTGEKAKYKHIKFDDLLAYDGKTNLRTMEKRTSECTTAVLFGDEQNLWGGNV